MIARGAPGSRQRVVRVRGLSVLVHPRTCAVSTALVLLVLGLSVTSFRLGDYPIAWGDLLPALGGRSTDPLANLFVAEEMTPRLVGGLLVGAALGTSGAIFQVVSGNPLGSPDIIGFTTGAASGALVQIIVFEAGGPAIAVGAVVGGFGSALLVYLLSWRGGVSGHRLVLVGIGVGAALAALNTLLVARASLVAAQISAQWLAGSLNAVFWPRVEVLAGAVTVLLVAAVLLARPLAMMALGDPIAAGAGIRVQRVRALVVLVGVGLVCVATATTGPIAFVALAAPHLVRRLCRTPTPGLLVSALMGAVLVVASDLVARRVFAPTELAVGVVTGALGGLYLVYVLVTEWKEQRG